MAEASMKRSREEEGKMVQDLKKPKVMWDPREIRCQAGRNVTLTTSFAKLRLYFRDKLYQYHITFDPPVESIGFRRKLLHQHDKIFGPHVVSGDSLFVQQALGDSNSLDLKSKGDKDEKVYVITLMMTNDNIHRGSREMQRIYNIVLKRLVRSLGYIQIHRGYFSAREETRHGQSRRTLEKSSNSDLKAKGLSVLSGFQFALSFCEAEVLLSNSLCFKVIREQTCLEYMDELTSRRELAEENLKGAVVMTPHNNRTYRIHSVDYALTPLSTFFHKKSDKNISYKDYYANCGLHIRNAGQPLLVVVQHIKRGNIVREEIIHLVPELCIMTGLTDSMRSDFNLMKSLGRITHVDPRQRMSELNRFNKQLTEKKNQEIETILNEWNLQVDSKLLELTGKELDPETIVFRGNQALRDPKNLRADWSQFFTERVKLMEERTVSNWLLLFHERDEHLAKRLAGTLLDTANSQFGMQMKDPFLEPFRDQRDMLKVLNPDDLNQRNIELVVCILQSRKEDFYQAFKKAVIESGRAVASQCIVNRNLQDERKSRSIITKLGLQIFAKCGSKLWVLPSVALRKPTMVCSYDIGHNKQGGVLAFVSSYDQFLAKYYSQSYVAPEGQSAVGSLGSAVIGALQCFTRKITKVENGARIGVFPEEIIIYRDGASASQTKAVYENEVKQIQDAFANVPGAYNPKLVFIIVDKKPSARFFGPNGNPNPGTVVDHTVTSDPMHLQSQGTRKEYEFFLISTLAKQGTVSPVKYHVVVDETNPEPGRFQTLSWRLCHMYYNQTATIAVPAPMQYAHKLAFHIGKYLKKPHPAEYNENPFYL